MTYLLHQAIEHAAVQYPEQTAICCAGQSLSYAGLVQHTNRLAWCLVEQGIKRGERVGIFMNKSLESVIAVYGIMQAGAVYVPLDPFAPVERLRYVIQDCSIRGLISSEEKLQSLQQLVVDPSSLEFIIGVAPQVAFPVRCIPWVDLLALSSTSSPAVKNIEQDLAYILYTSGSTGVPKGIMHTHRSGLSFAQWAANMYALHHDDRVSNHAPLHFDLSTFDLFATALAGAAMVIIPEGIAKFPASVAKLMEEERLTVWYSVPFALVQLLQKGGLPKRDLSRLRWILFAGEPFPTKHLRDLMAQLPNAGFSNLYGPTETNVCTYYHVPPLSQDCDEPIPIGCPCANVDDMVIDAADQPVIPGTVGELLIRSPLVMRGYWGRADLTERALFRRELLPGYEGIYYRTGDLVQLLPSGHYKYLGRKDRQIKTRGYRVELDEIESALLSHQWVEEAAVYVVPDNQGSQLIKAAVTPAHGTTLTPDSLFQHLATRLPAYALPVDIQIMTEFPRTSTGKIDRRALQTAAPIHA
jgi:amino acid adenylation domain-containing protein